MKRLCLLILSLSLLLTALVGCDRSYDEAEVKAAAEELLQKSILVNEIFYGTGMEYDEKSSAAIGHYCPVEKEYLDSIGISTTDGLRNLTKGVYTDALCEIIFSTKLESLRDSEGNVISFRRYYDGKVNGVGYLMAYTEADVRYDNTVEYLYETLTVTGADGEHINIEIDVLLTSTVGQTRTTRVEFSLLEEKGEFRLDTLSFVKF